MHPRGVWFTKPSFILTIFSKLQMLKLTENRFDFKPTGFGVASHLGVISNMCTIGIGKTLFHVDGIEKNRKHLEKVR